LAVVRQAQLSEDQASDALPPLSWGRVSIRPNNQPPPFAIPKGADDDENEINQSPNAQAAYCDYLQYSGSNLTHVESVYTKQSKKEAQQQGCETALWTSVGGFTCRTSRSAAMRTGACQARNNLAAASAKLLIGG
jgi:hypothetical protein